MRQGLRSYLDACVAFREFRLAVFEEGKRVMESRLPSLSKAINPKLTYDRKNIYLDAQPWGRS